MDEQSVDVEPDGDKSDSPADLTDKLSTLLISGEGNPRFVGKALPRKASLLC